MLYNIITTEGSVSKKGQQTCLCDPEIKTGYSGGSRAVPDNNDWVLGTAIAQSVNALYSYSFKYFNVGSNLVSFSCTCKINHFFLVLNRSFYVKQGTNTFCVN